VAAGGRGIANWVLPITVFGRDSSTVHASLFSCSEPKVVAMLSEIFMVRSEAKARSVEEVLPSSTSRFIPFSPRTQFTFKNTDPKVAEAPREEPPVGVIR
jgi:hypothetical protein